MKQTVANYIAKMLEQAGVKRIWGVTGDSLNGLSDSLNRMDTIEWMPTRHEEVAAFAAGAEAQLTGELAVCAGSCGPGNTITETPRFKMALRMARASTWGICSGEEISSQ